MKSPGRRARRGVRILLTLGMAQSSMLVAQELPFAISCSGSYETKSHFVSDEVPEVSVSQVTRIYIIDEAIKDVAFYNDAMDAPGHSAPNPGTAASSISIRR